MRCPGREGRGDGRKSTGLYCLEAIWRVEAPGREGLFHNVYCPSRGARPKEGEEKENIGKRSAAE